MKVCELCNGAARMYCESDQASLCWECDAKVHGANFLVARHARVLLCRSCQAPTQWRAAGARLSHTESACARCAAGGKRERDRIMEVHEYDDDGDDDDYSDDDDVSEEEEEEEEEEGDNQVVPWTLTTPPPASSSSGEDSSTQRKTSTGFLKRVRENEDLSSEDDSPCASSHHFSAQSAGIEDGPTSGSRGRRRLASPSVAAAGTGSNFRSRRSPAAFEFTSPASCSPSI